MVTLSHVGMKCFGLVQVADLFLGVGWENILAGYVGGNFCFGAAELASLEKG